jgi:DNA helicase II / ATP-dependent DNA helicase PcrA
MTATLTDPLAGLDPEQREVALAPWGPVCVLAGAGTGKTRALTHRIAYGVVERGLDPTRVLAVTFTTRAAGELRNRLRGLGVDGVQARTFHAAALRQLRFFWPTVVGGSVPEVLPHKASAVAEAAARCRVRVDRSVLRDLASEIEWAKVSQVAPDDYPSASQHAGREMPGDLPASEVARVYAAYDDVKRGRGLIDFEDVLLLTSAMLDDDASMARSVRAQYQHLLVDEYQDVSPVQQRLLDLWLGERRSLTVVGDAAQTIYSFTGSTPRFLLQFPHRYSDATVVRLVRDYRSTPQVVELANRVLASARTPAASTDPVAPEAGLDARLTLVAQRPDGPRPVVTGFDDEPAEAAGVAERVRALVAAGVAPRDVAVLYRMNAQSETFEDALATAGVSYVVRGSERFFDRPEVRQAVTLLRGAARAEDGATPQPPARAGDPAGPFDDVAHPDASADARSALATEVMSVLTALDFRSQAPSGQGAARERWESLAALVELADEVAARDPAAGLRQLVDEIEQRAAMQHAPSVDGVTLSTLHAAKGLEWHAVFLVGLVEGTLPITYATTPAQVEEERRLLYVGVTRAQEVLHLSWAAARSPGGRGRRAPSSFLAAAGLTASASSRGAGPSRRRRRQATLAHCRVCGRALATPVERKLGHCTDCEVDVDVALFERLREWRRQEASATSVPAYVVFTDATLTAIASSAPQDHAELATIPGVGARKLERYGDAVLALVAGGPVGPEGDPSGDSAGDPADGPAGGPAWGPAEGPAEGAVG